MSLKPLMGLSREPDQDAYPIDLQRATRVARTLAVARLVMIAMALLAIVVDPPHPSPAPEELFPVLGRYSVYVFLLSTYCLYSIAVVVAANVRPLEVIRLGRGIQMADFGWIVTLTLVSGGAASPFAAFFSFVLLAAGFRWGLLATLTTGLLAVAVLGLEAAAAEFLGAFPPVHLNTVLMRATYLGLGAVLVGILADEERRHRLRTQAITRIMSRVRTESGLVASVRAVFDELLSAFSAPRGVLAIEEEGRDRTFLWFIERPAPGRAPEVRLRHDHGGTRGVFTFDVPSTADVLRIDRRPSGRPDVVAVGASGIPRKRFDLDASSLIETPFSWQTALCVANVAGHGWTGRVFLFDPERADSHGLRFLQTVVFQVGPALFNLYLQRRLLSDSGVVERTRIARELHDGVIQSLIGLEMELEVLRRETAASIPEATRDRLADVQRMLGQEILTVRDLMHALRPVEVEPARLVEHMAETVERFRYRTGIEARLSCDLHTVDLSKRVCGELSFILQEALANVRKHSGAGSVLVRLSAVSGGYLLAVDDNGRGFEFDGLLTHDELDARRVGPVILKERVIALGGRLSIDSRPGRGCRLEIAIPAGERQLAGTMDHGPGTGDQGAGLGIRGRGRERQAPAWRAASQRDTP